MTPTLRILLLPLLAACTDKGVGDTGGAPDADMDGFTTAQGDCNDDDPNTFPGADERCNGVDDDCDQLVDEDAVDGDSWFVDSDGDGFGDDDVVVTGCTAPAGSTAQGGDCDDGLGDVFPGADEICNDRDDDCDDDVDEDAIDATDWYIDADGDGWGIDDTVAGCTQPDDSSEQAGDCDDGDAETNPDALELCSGADNDCNGRIDDAGCAVDLADRAWLWEERSLGEYWVRDLELADLSGDGQADLVLGQPASPALYGRVEVHPGPLDEDADPFESVAVVGALGGQGGYAIATGDVDGDGYDDLLASAPTEDLAAGGVYLYPGPITASSPVYTSQWLGEAQSDLLGQWVLELAGDLDGDGQTDLLVGAHGSDEVFDGGGLLYVLTSLPDGQADVAPAGITIQPEAEDQALGYAAAGPSDLAGASLGDIDGDGLADAFVGSLGMDAAHLLLGPLPAVISTADDDLRISGPAGSSLGSATAVADIDGDGALELMVGARSLSTSASNAGAVYVFEQSGGAALDATEARLRVDGVGADALLGGPDADLVARDIDGDGVDDLLLASPYAGSGGQAWLLYGHASLVGSGAADSLADLRFAAVEDDGELGAAVGLGDLDGDGIPEVVLAGAASPQLFMLPGTALVTP